MKINENQKVTLTLAQIKNLVKESRFGDKIKNLDDRNDEYNTRKISNQSEYIDNELCKQMLNDMNSIEMNDELPEAIQLVDRIDKIAYKRQIDDTMSRKSIYWGSKKHPGIDASEGCYGIRVGNGYTVWYNPGPKERGWGLGGMEDGQLGQYTPDELIDVLMEDFTIEYQKQFADAIHKMADELPAFLSKVEQCYNEFVKLSGVKEAENIKLNENQKVTLTVGQLKKLVKESSAQDVLPDLIEDISWEPYDGHELVSGALYLFAPKGERGLRAHFFDPRDKEFWSSGYVLAQENEKV